MRTLFRLNIAAFFLVAIMSIIPMEATFAGRIGQSLIELFAIFVLPGINMVALLQYFIRKKFSFLETLSLSAAFSLFVLPFILAVEFTIYERVFPSLSLVNALLIFITLSGVFFSVSRKQHKGLVFPEPSLFLFSNWKLFRSKEFFLSLILYTAVSVAMVTAFYPLPDLDPYYWYTAFQKLFSNGDLVSITGHRPLFAALSHIFILGAHVDPYAFFKFILPFLFLSLIFPITLLSSLFTLPLQRAAILLLPFTSGIIIIYLTLPIPQAIANITCFFAAAIITYAWMRNRSFFFLIGGIILCFGYLYHEAMALPIVIWFAASAYHFRQEIFLFVRSNKLSSFLLIILIAPYLSVPISVIFSGVLLQLNVLTELRTNFLFPEYYINIDGNRMGWESIPGVIKYYLFYVGPVLALIFSALFFERDRVFRRKVLFSKYAAPLTLSFLAFLIIAEALPRFFSIAFLPDRAWVFAGAFAIVFIPPLFASSMGRNRIFLWMIILGFSLNIGAAIYFNTLKKYVITEPQLSSAQWIKRNLPEKRMLFTTDHKNLLSFYSQSEITLVSDPNFFFDNETFEREISKFHRSKRELSDAQKQEIAELKEILDEISTDRSRKYDDSLNALLLRGETVFSEARTALQEYPTSGTTAPDNLYIFYAEPDPRNPYLDRPYMKKVIGKEQDMLFNKDPSRFKNIYSDNENHIYLWKIL